MAAFTDGLAFFVAVDVEEEIKSASNTSTGPFCAAR
jgi:hypothetical protein